MKSDYPGGNYEAMLRLLAQLSFCRSADEVMTAVTRSVRQVMAADGAAFILRDGENVRYANESAAVPLWNGRQLAASACISGRVMQNGQAAVIEDVHRDPRVSPGDYRQALVSSLAMVAVRREDPFAAIGVYWAQRHRATPEEIDLLQTVADAAARAWENVQVYADLKAALARAEAESAAKDEWLSIIGHELRTPLTPVYGWFRLLQEKLVQPERTAEAFDIIGRNLDLHLRLLDDLLDVSRLLAGKLRIQRSAVDARDCVSRAVLNLRAGADAKFIRLAVAIAPVPCPVSGDADRICQIVHNLLHNAIKFSPEHGQVEIAARRSGAFTELVVSDHGAGIASDRLPHLFDRWRRSAGARPTADDGLGLGLWMVQQLTGLHGGTVAAHSDGPGAGSVFTVRLPLDPTAV